MRVWRKMADTKELFRLAKKFEPRIAKALQGVFSNVRSQLTLKMVEETLRHSGITGVLGLLDKIELENQIEHALIDELTDAVMESGRMMVQILPKGAIIQPFRFSVLDTQTVNALTTHRAALVREVGMNTRIAITKNLESNIIAGVNPRAAARDFRASVGLTERQERAVRNFRDALRNKDVKALTRELRDKRFDRTVRRLLNDEKVSQTKINQMVSRYRERFIKYRTEVIARTESLRATSMGEYESLRQAEEQGRVVHQLGRYWIYTTDERTRAAHREIPAMNPEVIGPKQIFKTPLGPLRYPRDPEGTPANTIQCRCRLGYKLME